MQPKSFVWHNYPHGPLAKRAPAPNHILSTDKNPKTIEEELKCHCEPVLKEWRDGHWVTVIKQ